MEEKIFEEDTLITRNDDDFLITEVDGESVIMNINTGNYFGLNSVSTDIWKYLETPLKFKDIIKKLTSEYEVKKETCDAETRPLLFQLLRFGIVKKS